MNNNLNVFLRDLDKFAENINMGLPVFIKHLSLFVFRGVVLKTPVDTGRARASWNIGIGNEDLTVEDASKFSVRVSTGASQSAMENKGTSAAFAKINRLNRIDLKNPQVYITNNLPYINRLEDGYSKAQAPKGMVRLTMLEAVRYARSLKK